MTALFSTPKTQVIPQPTPVPVPTIDDAAQNADLANKFLRRRGRLATYTPDAGQPATVATKQLLG